MYYYKNEFDFLQMSFTNPNLTSNYLNFKEICKDDELNNLEKFSYTEVYYLKNDILKVVTSILQRHVYFKKITFHLEIEKDIIVNIYEREKFFD